MGGEDAVTPKPGMDNAKAKTMCGESGSGGALAPTLGTVQDVFHKLRRERHRAFHARDRIHKADHLYNFCITAQSLRDYYKKEQQLSCAEAQEHDEAWNQIKVLQAVKDIANTAKHFRLWKIPETKNVAEGVAGVVDVYHGAAHDFILVPTEGPDYSITFWSGDKYNLWEFLENVESYWKCFLTKNGVTIEEDPHYFPIDEFPGSRACACRRGGWGGSR